MVDELIGENQARVNVTYAGENGDLPDTVSRDATDGDVLQIVVEAVRTGGVRGIKANANVDFEGYVIERFKPDADYPYNRMMIRPKTPYGA